MSYGYKSSLTVQKEKVHGPPGSHAVDLEESSSQYASISDANQSGLDITGDFTIESWIKLEQLPSSVPDFFTIVGKYEDNGDERAYWFNVRNDDKLQIQASQDGTTTNRIVVQTTDAVFTSADVGKWFHVAVTVDISAGASGVTFYLNGESITDTTALVDTGTSVYNSSAPFAISARFDTGSALDFFDGQINDVRVWNDIRTQSEIQDNMSIQLAGTETNLQGYWRFDNDYTDETSNSNDLTSSGSPTFTALSEDHSNYAMLVSGTYDGTGTEPDIRTEVFGTHSLTLDDTSDECAYISDANQTGLDITADLTCEAWIKLDEMPSTSGNYMYIMGKANPGGDDRAYYCYINPSNDSIYITFSQGGGTTNYSVASQTTASLTTDTWYHIAFSIDSSAGASGISLYINGESEPVGTGADTGTSIHDSDAPFVLGGVDDNAGGFGSTLSGEILEARIWDDIRTQTEIQDNMYSVLAGSETNLQGYWRLDNDYADETSNGNDLTANSTPTFTSIGPGRISNLDDTGGASGSVTVPADLIFTSDEAGTTQLDHEIEYYDPVTGEIVAWVEIPTLDIDADTVIWMHYGDSAVTTSQENVAGTWNANYLAVYHLGEGGGTAYDSASTNNATDNASATGTIGKIGDGQEFDGADDYYDIGGLGNHGEVTIQCWFRGHDVSENTEFHGLVSADAWEEGVIHFPIKNSVIDVYLHAGGTERGRLTSSTLSDNTWYLTHLTGNATNDEISLYLDGGLEDSDDTFTLSTDFKLLSQAIAGEDITGDSRYFDGNMDEVRILNTALDSDWILTEYNNQSSPSTFYTMGSETATAVDVNDEINAKVTGQQSTNDEIPAKLSGIDTTSSEISAKTTGVDTTQSEIPAKTTGKQSATSEIPAKLTGVAGSSSEIPAKVTGVDTTSSEIGAKTTGSQDANDEIPAKLSGVDTTSGEVPAKVTGKDTASGEIPAKTTGKQSTSGEISAKLSGVNADSSEIPAKLTGGYVTPQYLYWTKINSGSYGILKVVVHERDVTTPDDSSIDWHVSADGGSNWEAVTAEVAHDIVNNGNDLRVRATLNASSDGQSSPTLTEVSFVWTGVLGEIQAKVTGQDDATSEISAKIAGQVADSSEIPAKIRGGNGASGEIPAKLTGKDTAQDEIDAKITGKTTTSDEISAKLTGGVSTSSEIPAKLTGGSAASSDIPAKVTGVDTTSDEIPASVTGKETSSAEISVKLTGQPVGPTSWQDVGGGETGWKAGTGVSTDWAGAADKETGWKDSDEESTTWTDSSEPDTSWKS